MSRTLTFTVHAGLISRRSGLGSNYCSWTLNFVCLSVCLCVALLLLLLLLLLALRRHRQHLESYAAVGNPDDDVRENIIHYDEEGFGTVCSIHLHSSNKMLAERKKKKNDELRT